MHPPPSSWVQDYAGGRRHHIGVARNLRHQCGRMGRAVALNAVRIWCHPPGAQKFVRRSTDEKGSAPARRAHSSHLRTPYFFTASWAAGVAARHAPLPSLPPFSSHFILAFSQSALLVGVGAAVCAIATEANAQAATSATTGSSFM